MKQIGERIKTYRMMVGMSQEELARKVGAHSGVTVRQWENHRRQPRIDTLKKIADALNVTFESLLLPEIPKPGNHMTPNEYQLEALRTASGMNKEYPMSLNGVMGLAGESGECVDMMKKHLFQGHPLEVEHMAKELGDVAWYLAITAHAIGYDLETILQMNVDKLRKRYPNGFEAQRSLHREEGDI